MKNFYEMMMILENQPAPEQPVAGQQMPPEIERERQLRMKMDSSQEEHRIWDMIDDALRKHGVKNDPLEGGQDEWNMLYGKHVDMTLFTHDKGPYSGIYKVSGVVMPTDFEADEGGRGYPEGYEIDGRKFDPYSIAAIHRISHHQSLSEIEQDFADDAEYWRDYHKPARYL